LTSKNLHEHSAVKRSLHVNSWKRYNEELSIFCWLHRKHLEYAASETMKSKYGW